MNENKYARFAYLIIAISFLIRFTIPFYFFSDWLTIDSKNYILQANALLDGGFGLYFPNGFPALIALVTLIVGKESTVTTIIILNIILSTASVYLFWLICKNYFGPGLLSLIAVVIFAFYPNQLNYVRFVLTEVPDLFFLMLSFYFISRENFLAAALLIGIAAAIKTTLIPVILFFGIYLLFKKIKINGFKYLGFAFIPLILMMIYGYIITNKLTLGYSAIHNFYLATNQTELLSTNYIDAIEYYFNYAFTSANQFLVDRFQSLWEFWGFLPSSNEGLRSSLFFQFLIGIRFPLLVLAIYGYIKSDKNIIVVFSALVIFLLTLLHFIFYSIPRYNFVIEPFLIFLAIIGIKEISNKKTEK